MADMLEKIINTVQDFLKSDQEKRHIVREYITARGLLEEMRGDIPDPEYGPAKNARADAERLVREAGYEGLQEVNEHLDEKILVLESYIVSSKSVGISTLPAQIKVFDATYEQGRKRAAKDEDPRDAGLDAVNEELRRAEKFGVHITHARNGGEDRGWVVSVEESCYSGKRKGR